jgi:hypothetical protein
MRRVPATLTLNSSLLQGIAMRAGLSKQHIDLLQSAAGSLRAVVPHVSGGEETADQRPDENLGADGGDAGAAAEDHDPGGEPLASGAEGAGDVAVAEGGDFGALRESVSLQSWREGKRDKKELTVDPASTEPAEREDDVVKDDEHDGCPVGGGGRVGDGCKADVD